VNAAYYDLVQQQQLAALDTTIVISNQRLTLAQNRFTIGKASKLEVLKQVDLNTDQVALLRQKNCTNSKILLNQLMARDTDFKVIDVLKVDALLLLPELKLWPKSKIPIRNANY
jgi:outer membrane protein TolC